MCQFNAKNKHRREFLSNSIYFSFRSRLFLFWSILNRQCKHLNVRFLVSNMCRRLCVISILSSLTCNNFELFETSTIAWNQNCSLHHFTDDNFFSASFRLVSILLSHPNLNKLQLISSINFLALLTNWQALILFYGSQYHVVLLYMVGSSVIRYQFIFKNRHNNTITIPMVILIYSCHITTLSCCTRREKKRTLSKKHGGMLDVHRLIVVIHWFGSFSHKTVICPHFFTAKSLGHIWISKI